MAVPQVTLQMPGRLSDRFGKGAKQTLLIVSDDLRLRASLAQIVMAAGYTVELADGARRARAVAAKKPIVLSIVIAELIDQKKCELAGDLADRTGGVLVATTNSAGFALSCETIDLVETLIPEEIMARVQATLRQRSDTAPTDEADLNVLRIADFQLDLTRHILLDPRGQEVILTAGEFALLATFASSRGRVLTRDHLRNSLSGRGVEAYDRSIDVMVSRLRRKIEYDPKHPAIIVTIPGAGYKLAANVESQPAGPLSPPALAVVTAVRPSIAVLPFVPMSGGSDLEHFGDGLAEDVITALSRNSDLVVVARNSSFAYKGKAIDVRELGRALGTKYLIEGSLRRVGERLRVVAQLIDSDDGSHIWADRFDCQIGDDPLLTQDHVTREIVTAVRFKLIREVLLLGTDRVSRQLVTVLYCRLISDPAWSDRTDPKTARYPLDAYQRYCADAIIRCGGIVALPWADVVEAYFGLPPVLERGAESAVRAAIEIRESVRQIVNGFGDSFRVQIGIATGTAIIGDLGSNRETLHYSAVGEPVDLARRLADQLESITICGRTRELVGGLFEYGATKPGPIEACHVITGIRAGSRFAALHERGLLPLVGRADEIARLTRLWSDAKCEAGQVVFISGDPGLGKSRLVAALRERIEREPHAVINYACAPHRANSALFPIIEQIEWAAALNRHDTAEEKLTKLEALLQDSTRGSADATGLMAELMSLPNAVTPTVLSPQQRKQLIFDVLLRYVEIQSEKQPTFIEFEDLHWADSSTIEFLTRLVERLPSMRALVAITARPGFEIPWPAPEYGSEIKLTRLNRRDSASLAAWVAHDQPLSRSQIERIVDRADGIPLFIEELAKSVIGRCGTSDAATESIPVTLESSLLTRLHWLSSVDDLTAAGAAIGRQFSHELVGAVTSLPDQVLTDKLDQLVKAGLIFRVGTPPDVVYTFKHALVRDAFYSRLSDQARRTLHARLADVIETSFPEIAQGQPGIVAEHCMGGHLFDKAVEYAFRAGKKAVMLAAMREAIGQLRLALNALEHLPENRTRAELEVEILLLLLTALVSNRGYNDPETSDTYARASARCREIGAISKLEAIDQGIYRQYLVEANYPGALRICQEAHASGRSGWELGIGIVKMHQGDLASALDWLQRAYAAIGSRARTEDLEVLPVIGAPAYLALCQSLRGEHEQARLLVQEALAISEQLGHPTARAFALSTTARVTWLLGLEAQNLEIATELAAICRKHDFRYWLANTECYLGWHMAKDGRAADGAARIERGLAGYRDTAARWLYPFFLAMAAEVDRADRRPADALKRVEEALTLRSSTGELWYDGGLLRLRGTLLREMGDRVEFEKCLASALATVNRQGANLFGPPLVAELALS